MARLLIIILVLLPYSYGEDSLLSDKLKNWWKTGAFYQIYPRSFMDTDGDGVGDLPGITEKLEYLEFLGINGIWLSPIFESPMKDFGYDIKNYTNIDPLFGTLDDFRVLIDEAKSKDLKITLDFVPNHSSDQHEWFQKSRLREDPYTDYYVWEDGKSETEPPNNWMSMFGGSAWDWDPVRKQFYYHQFLKEQPDFNFRNPLVIEEMKNVLKFWLDLDVAGFRIDTMKHLLEDPLLRDEPLSNDPTAKPDEYNSLLHIYTTSQPGVFDILSKFRDVLDEYEKKDGLHRVMMVEINETIPNTVAYFGNETHPLADIPFNFELFKFSKTSTAEDLHKLVSDWINGVPASKWPNWIIGNHDQHRIANRTDVQLVDAFNMINLLLRGTPIIYYGEEIGMTDTFISWDQTRDPWGLWFGPERYAKFSRDPERTPMQWNKEDFAGFTEGKETWLPVNPNYVEVNVEAEKKDAHSHLNVFRLLMNLRQTPAVLMGKISYPIVTSTIFSFAQVVADAPGLVTLTNLGNEEETLNLVEITTKEKFSFPSKGIIKAFSTNLPSDSKLLNLHFYTDLDSIKLGPKQAVVLEFEPLWK